MLVDVFRVWNSDRPHQHFVDALMAAGAIRRFRDDES